jgi:deoxyadenosine/deoxycytidine kinase
MRIISLEGNIGSGKSTVLAALAAEYETRPEPVAQWTPWLERFYAAPHGMAALGLQLQVLASFHSIYVELRGTATVLVERSPRTGKDAFTALMVQSGALAAHELALYQQLYAKLAWEPTERIYLQCAPELALKRIQVRHREHEEPVGLAYLTALHEKHEELYAKTAHVIDAAQEPAAIVAAVRRYLSS